MFVSMPVLAMPANSPNPIGIRNNNPGNIVESPITWKGEIDCDSRFECFSTPELGIRALALNLLSYYFNDNLKTVNDIISKWSPHHENDTDTIIQSFIDRYGDGDANVYDYERFREFVVNIIIQENGFNPYGDEIDKALGSINAYNMMEYWRNNDSIRTSNPTRLNVSGRGAEDLVEETRHSSIKPPSVTRESGCATKRVQGSKGTVFSPNGMDKKSDSPYSYIFRNSLTKVSSPIHGYHSRSRLDRNDFWFPLLYGWNRNIEVVRSKRIGNHTTGHSPNECNSWTLLRRKHRKWPTIR